MKTGVKKNSKSFIAAFMSVCVLMVSLFVGSASTAEAKTFVIKTPDQLKNINWKNAGYGPGHTYIIGNDMTLGEEDDSTCLLTKGKFVIDFNGHTVQNRTKNLTVFKVAGADVVMKDSKVKKNVPSVRSYGAGAVQIVSGKLTILSGNYFGLSEGTNDPSGLHVGGGTCIVNGGGFYGDYVGASCMGGTLKINGGAFQAGYSFGLMRFGSGNIKISKGVFFSGTTTYNYHFALGYYKADNYYDFSSWLASGSSFDQYFDVGYWNMQTSVTAYPTIANYWAVSYNTPKLTVNRGAKAPATSIKSITAGKKFLTVKWNKKTKRCNGYVLQYSTNSKFKKAKTLTVKGAKKSKARITKLKSGKKYYVRIRTFRSFNGTKLNSKWSKAKSKKVK